MNETNLLISDFSSAYANSMDEKVIGFPFGRKGCLECTYANVKGFGGRKIYVSRKILPGNKSK